MLTYVNNYKRLFPRIPVKGALRYQIRGTHDIRNTVYENIGEGGIGFTCDRFIAPNTALNLEINSLARLLQPIGKVVWAVPCSAYSDRYKVGVQFLEIATHEKNILTDYITMKLNQT